LKKKSALTRTLSLETTNGLKEKSSRIKSRITPISDFNIPIKKIEKASNDIKELINQRADLLKREIDASTKKLLIEVDIRREEVIEDFYMRYWMNQNISSMREKMVKTYQALNDALSKLDEHQLDQLGAKKLDEELELIDKNIVSLIELNSIMNF
jgi:hypothetical protein